MGLSDLMDFPIDAVRARFPALSVNDAGGQRVYFDAPGGTQICQDAIDGWQPANKARRAFVAAAREAHLITKS